MIKTLSLAVLLASPVSAGTPLQNAALLAAEIGAPAPAAFEAPRAPAARETELVRVAQKAPLTGTISGSIWVDGSGFLSCSAHGNGMGWMSGWISLRGPASVRLPDGVTGEIPMHGTIYVSGSCQQNRGGHLSGSGTISGSDPLYKAGKRVGFVSLDGHAFINQYASSDYVWVNQYVSVSGEYRLD